MAESLEQLLTISQVAEILAVSEKTVRRMIDAGELPVITIGRSKRVHPTDLTRFIRARRED